MTNTYKGELVSLTSLPAAPASPLSPCRRDTAQTDAHTHTSNLEHLVGNIFINDPDDPTNLSPVFAREAVLTLKRKDRIHYCTKHERTRAMPTSAGDSEPLRTDQSLVTDPGIHCFHQ